MLAAGLFIDLQYFEAKAQSTRSSEAPCAPPRPPARARRLRLARPNRHRRPARRRSRLHRPRARRRPSPPPPALVAAAPDAPSPWTLRFSSTRTRPPRASTRRPPSAGRPARLALLPGVERSWSVVRVVRCEGTRAVIVGRDARISTRPLASLRALRLAAGVEVMALWEGATPYHAVVTSLRGDEVHVRYDDGSEESLDALRLDAVTVTEAPPAHVCPLAAGLRRRCWCRARAWRGGGGRVRRRERAGGDGPRRARGGAGGRAHAGDVRGGRPGDDPLA